MVTIAKIGAADNYLEEGMVTQKRGIAIQMNAPRLDLSRETISLHPSRDAFFLRSPYKSHG